MNDQKTPGEAWLVEAARACMDGHPQTAMAPRTVDKSHYEWL